MTGTMGGTSLPGGDAFWLRAETPENRLVVHGFLALEGTLALDRLKAEVGRGLLGLERFRRPVIVEGGTARWGDDEGFDPDRHFERLVLAPPADEPAFRAWLGRTIASPLDPSRPLWKIYLVDGLREGSVVVARIHHCIGDGIALVQVLLSLAEEIEPPPSASAVEPSGWARGAVDRAGDLVHRGWRFVEHLGPSALRRSGEALSRAVGRVTLLPSQDHPAFKGRLGVEKAVAWSQPLSLDAIKTMGRAVDGKVNDVLLALAAGALRRYLDARGAPVGPDEDLRATVPVNLRPLDEAHQLGNRFGLVFMHLPVAVPDVRGRLEAVKREMDAIKASPEALVTFGLMKAVGLGGAALERQIVDVFSRKASLVLSNVPGPRRRLRFAGLPVRRLMFWVPQSGTISLGLSIISYAGEVMLGVLGDRGLFPDLDALTDAIHAEHDHMAERLNR